MVEQGGYEYINEQTINDLLKCSICMKPFIDPISTKCDTKSHIFCRQCIEERIRSSQSCSICNQNLRTIDLIPITDGIIRDMLDQIRIKCQLCEQTGLKRCDFVAHKMKICPKVNMQCPSSDIRCPWIGTRDQLDQHVNICIFETLKPLIIELRNENQQLRDQINQQQTQREQQLQKQVEQWNERLKLLELMNYRPLACKGRPCLKCKKCSDWYHDGREWKRRNDYICIDYVTSDVVTGVGHHAGGFFGGGGDILCQCRI